MEGRTIKISQGDGPCSGRFSFTNAEIHLKPGEKELSVELGDGFVVKFIAPPNPTKKYPFAEAYQMMRQGKWMSSLYTRQQYKFCGSYLNWRLPDDVAGGSVVSTHGQTFQLGELHSDWEEVS